MIYLAGPSDVLRLVTSAAVAVDVLVSFVDLTIASGASSPGRTRTAISTATTTSITAAVASGVVKTIKSAAIRNRHATTAVDITVQHYDGSTAFELLMVTLPAGHTLTYQEGAEGWAVIDPFGRRLGVATLAATNTPAVNALNLAVLGADVTNNNGVANTIADVTGLSFPVVAGETYWFSFAIWFTAAATTTGSRWSINGPASPTFLGFVVKIPLVNTANSTNSTSETHASAYDNPTTCNASSPTATAAQAQLATIEGVIRPSANGTVIARFASEVASSAIVAKAGSHVQYVRTL